MDDNIDGRLWRVEQRQQDVLTRIDKIEAKIETMVQRQDDRSWRISSIESRLDILEKRRNGTFLTSVDPALVKTVLYGLLAMVGALATGQFARLLGLFGN